MSNMSNQGGKDDLDLDAQDLDAMADSGEDVAIVGPTRQPGGGEFFNAPTSVGGRTVVTRPSLGRRSVTNELTRT
jgi:hypothetical protein